MLKRYQVLLSDWQEDYIKFLSEKYDVSTSEVIRVQLCIAILAAIPILFPEYKSDFGVKDIVESTKKADKDGIGEEEGHRMLSKLYFEARKAVEFRQSKAKKLKK